MLWSFIETYYFSSLVSFHLFYVLCIVRSFLVCCIFVCVSVLVLSVLLLWSCLACSVFVCSLLGHGAQGPTPGCSVLKPWLIEKYAPK